MERDTRIQHLGDDRERFLRAAAPPVFRTSLFTFPTTEALERSLRGGDDSFVYTRVANPTTRILETKIADLEGTQDAMAFGSGMGAISATLLGLLGQGDHLVLQEGAYGPALSMATDVLPRFGIQVSIVPSHEVVRLADHLRPNTRLVYLESPASLTFDVVDLEAAARIAHTRGIPVVCDNSWATPIYCQPAKLGIDLVIHSATKYIGGHSDLVMGLVAGGGDLFRRVRGLAITLGATPSPEDSFLALRGLRTLPLRLRQHETSGLQIANALAAHRKVGAVYHPALPSCPGHEIAKRQFTGSSGLFAFQLHGNARRFVDALKLFSIGVSWGGYESLAIAVNAATPRSKGKEIRVDLTENGNGNGLVRLSVGLEDPRDLIADLERGFQAI